MMAPVAPLNAANSNRATNGSASNAGPRGPHPSFIQTAKPYVFEQTVEQCLSSLNASETKEDNIRLQGVAWVDAVRKELQLPVKTYNTACVHFHKFRLVHAETEYNYIDAVAAALILACKIEDTQKRTKEILATAYNLKVLHGDQLSSDDPLFEVPARTIVGLERLMLEASSFDFRSRHPQKIMLKLARQYHIDRERVGKIAFRMSLDLYRTFAPLKHTTAGMAMGCLELSGRLAGVHIKELEDGRDYEGWYVTRAEVMETMLDLLDLYTHHRTSTLLGQDHPLDLFINVRIPLNQEAAALRLPRFTVSTTLNDTTSPTANDTQNGHHINGGRAVPPEGGNTDPSKEHGGLPGPTLMGPTSADGGRPKLGPHGQEGTVRFMLNPDRAREEKATVSDFFKVSGMNENAINADGHR
ncbi:MAG: RNA polymerase II C-terminal domain kinase beta subunit [Cirrosporium novae-zelandiae]|nr:MAG: RNA polymerase II C-terminal domain kinase beta subunit [Cirrosporium novae-zelandiae]